MGSQEILNYLKKNKMKTSKEIAEETDRSLSSVTICLQRLRKTNEIKFIKQKQRGAEKFVYYIK